MSNEFGPRLLFAAHPDPMWIYDTETLAVLDVNDAALQVYGHTRAEFLSMAANELSLPIPRTLDLVPDRPHETIRHRRQRANGAPFDVDVTVERFDLAGRPAMIVAERDITRLVQLENEIATTREREAKSRKDSEVANRNFLALLEAMPGQYLVIKPETFEIVAASDTYLKATMTTRADLYGRYVFDAFPDDPGDPISDGARHIRASFERVASLGLTDILPLQRYPIRTSGAAGGQFEERFWSVVNTPVKQADGAVSLIINRVEDVTDLVRSNSLANGELATLEQFEGDNKRLGLDILLRSQELKSANDRLLEQDASLRTARKLLRIGTWKLNIGSGILSWSDEVYELYGVNRSEFSHTFEGYVELVFSEDREGMVANYERFAVSAEVSFEFEHRVEVAGRVVRLRGSAELTESADGRFLTGVVQDITALVDSNAQLSRANALLGLAGRAAQLGGWRLQLDPERLAWTPQVAAIHGEPEGFTPTLEQALDYYRPADRTLISAALDACIKHGTPFDEVMQLTTANGEDLWVRAIGEPEYDTDSKIVALQGAFQNVSELIQARGQVGEVSKRLEDTLENISDAFFILDPNWRFTFINSEAERLLGRERATLLNLVVWDEFPEAVGGPFHENYLRVAQTRETARFTAFFDPLEAWFDVTVYAADHGLAVHFRDVTLERASAQQLLLLETAVSRINDILLITEAEPIDAPDGPKIVYVNDAFVRRTGYSREEVIGKTPRILQGPKTQRDRLGTIHQALESWKPSRTELINYTKAGEEFWLELEITPIADESGWYTHWVAVERDITERKKDEEVVRRAQQSVAESERIQRSLALSLAKETERLNFAQTVAGVGSWETDPQTYAVAWSPTLYDIFSLRPDQFDGTHEGFLALVHPEDRQIVEEAFAQSLTGAEGVHKVDHRIVTSDGSIKAVIERWKVQRDPEGKPQRITGTTQDITERMALEEMLRQSQKMEAIGQLTGGVAHDFNNVLTIILANAELLSDQLSDQAQLQILADMTATAAERGAELTNQLLAFARRQPLEPKIVDVGRLVGGMDGLLRRTTPEDIDIEVVKAGGLWMAELDPTQLESAIINLALNASHAMPNGGRLTIETGNATLDDDYANAHAEVDPGQYVMVSVSDSGIGMSSSVLEKAFDPFFTTKEVGKGTGLGLSMVYGFLKQSRGHAKIYSEVGHGTVVKLYFPRAKSTVGPDGIIERDFRVVGGTEHILVVEDDDLVRQNLTNQLIVLGYRVTQARSGQEALEQMRALTDIDLLFTDVVMPGGMNGQQLAVQAQALQPGLKVLFTSGYTKNAIVHNGRLDAGAYLLSKPYRRHTMAAKVRAVLDGANIP